MTYRNKRIAVLACAAVAASICAPTVFTQVAGDEVTVDIDQWYPEGRSSAESAAGGGQSTGSSLAVGHRNVNNADSGALLFEEDIDNSPSCGFAFDHDGSTNQLSLLSGCSGIPFTTVVAAFARGTARTGLGRAPDTNRLEVEGNASKTTAGSWLANSDRSIKYDVQEITDALAVVERLRPVEFRYTGAFRSQHPSVQDFHYANFIAQEFQQVFPNSVKAGGDGLLQVDSYVVRPYLVAAVQELSATVEQLREQNDELRKRLNALERRLAN